MKQEEKELVLKDLCARLPYGVRIHIDFKTPISHIVGEAILNTITSQTNQTFDFIDFEQDFNNGDIAPISGNSGSKLLKVGEFKPYLRPMSSMTEEEKKEFQEIKLSYHFDEDGYILFDWLNKHHFDYRGLIEKGLALEASEGMYN